MITLNRFLAAAWLSLTPTPGWTAEAPPSLDQRSAGLQRMDGFFPMYWDANAGQLLLEVNRFGERFLYQTSMPWGVGSNDLLLDRGQLGSTQVARFHRSGNRVLLIADNLAFRADSDNPDEIEAVERSFAESVLWGFEIVAASADAVLVDTTAFFLRDSHGLAARLKAAGQGSYTADASRSVIETGRTRNFPDNTEIEAIVTLTGQPDDGAVILPSVVPDATAVTVRLHHSLIRLPDDGYQPLPYDPRAGYFAVPDDGYLDFSSEIGTPMRVQFAPRHRLNKVDPGAESSRAVEPIVYYLDRGVPEPVRSALLEGASWWNQAFEAAGYVDAFRVEILPEGADPMDVRYNVIQWVHRSTRGWSYGGSVVDPRSGEIIKGHVTLGSLRVRQDYLIAEGLLSPYSGVRREDAMLEMSLARIRQLSAHEVGHTLGLTHNFAASVNDRASVMDYPFPLIRFGAQGELDLSQAYDTGIGEWDRRAIEWAYRDFPADQDAAAARAAILADTLASGLLFVADSDARDSGTAHPLGNLWDNGADAVAELEHLVRVRAHALARFSLNNIREGRPEATLEEVLVPIYLLHRFQLEAAGKLLGGHDFRYELRGDGQPDPAPVAADRQRHALAALLATLEPGFLALPETLATLIPPRPPEMGLNRETFARDTGPLFDPLAPAAASVELTLDVLLHPWRLARLHRQAAGDSRLPGVTSLLEQLMEATWRADRRSGIEGAIQRATAMQVLDRVLSLYRDTALDDDIRAAALAATTGLQDWLETQAARRLQVEWLQHLRWAQRRIAAGLDESAGFAPARAPTPPPGSPVGN